MANKKGGLGRGLNSLLGGETESTLPKETTIAVENEPPREHKPAVPVPPAPKEVKVEEKIDTLSASTKEEIVELWEALNKETSERISADTEIHQELNTLSDKLDDEISARISSDEALWEALIIPLLLRRR